MSHTPADSAVLQQRQLLSLPGYDIELHRGKRLKAFRYLDKQSLSKKFKYADPELFNTWLVQKGRWEQVRVRLPGPLHLLPNLPNRLCQPGESAISNCEKRPRICFQSYCSAASFYSPYSFYHRVICGTISIRPTGVDSR
jgi:hypothetical protein